MSETNEQASAVMKDAGQPDGLAKPEQSELFDRLRSGDDPVHEEARTELVKPPDQALELLDSLSVRKVDSEPGVQRVLTKPGIIAGHKVEEFTLHVYVEGYDPSDDQLMADLTDAAKGRFTDDQKLALVLLNNPEVELVDTDRDDFEGTRTFYFRTYDPVVAEEYGFMGETEETAAAREEAAAAREKDAALARERFDNIADPEVKAAALALAESKGPVPAVAIYTAVVQVARDTKMQAEMLRLNAA